MKRKDGFTLIELLVVIVIIGILVAIALPNFIKIKDKAKEAEVKSNLHAIQLALERYATDSENAIYPGWIYGGDYVDTNAITQAYYDLSDLSPADWPPGWTQDFALDGDGDTLLMEGYVMKYPENPFIKKGSASFVRTITHTSTRPPGSFFRRVGGTSGSLMVEIFGPPPYGPTAGLGCQGDTWIIPIYNPSDYTGVTKQIVANAKPDGSPILVGNFSYFTMLDGNDPYGSAWGIIPWGDPIGYHLCGYGAKRSKGLDVYDQNAGYEGYGGKARTCPCNYTYLEGAFAPILVCQAAGQPSVLYQYSRGGPDTRPDGVIVVLDSGIDIKSQNPGGATQTGTMSD